MSAPQQPPRDEITRAMRRLGYSAMWLELGMLNESDILEQLQRLESTDPSWDDFDWHLRIETFDRYWTREPRTPERAEHVVRLAEHEAETGDSYLLRLLLEDNQDLSEEMFDRVARKLEDIDRFVLKARLLRELRLRGPSTEWFRAAITSNVRDVQRAAVESTAVPDWVLSQLAESATSKTVRNMAENTLKRRQRTNHS